MKFGKIINNEVIKAYNVTKIENFHNKGYITFIQYNYLISNISKWYKICHHKGLFWEKDDKFYFITRTSMDNNLTKTKNYEYIKSNIHDFNESKIDIIKFNERCMIPNVRWVLGSKDDENLFKFNDLENNPTIITKLVGSLDDLDALKKWVNTLDLESYDISDYFNIDNMLENLKIYNIENGIIIIKKDEE